MKTAREIIIKKREQIKKNEPNYEEALEAVETAIDSLEERIMRSHRIYGVDEVVFYHDEIPQILLEEISEAGFVVQKEQFDEFWHIWIK